MFKFLQLTEKRPQAEFGNLSDDQRQLSQIRDNAERHDYRDDYQGIKQMNLIDFLLVEL